MLQSNIQCNGAKLEESEGYNCFFIISCELRALVFELLSNKSRFVGQL